ncbi:MAG: hypothetical protein ABSE49_22090 [Polyangiaceae bacterium]|jgi:hypothetical protein
MSDQRLAACAEFPNDNPGLHRGAIWYCADVIGAAVCERPETLIVATRVWADEPPPPVEVASEPATDPTPPVLEADDDVDDIEIVETLAFDDTIDESPLPPPLPESEPEVIVAAVESVAPPPADDPFVMLVAVLEDVARNAGADDATLATLACLLGRTRLGAGAPEGHATLRAQALAWQGILRGESEDFTACGAGMLDEWCAALVAGVLGQNTRADGLKRELRRRGVAAFGLVEQAA